MAAERCALVVGVSDYQVFGQLDNPRQDHAAMVKVLLQVGFAVTEMHNPTRQQLEEITRRFSQDNQDAREVVVYYSGHGLQVQGRNYLTGTDSQLEVTKGLEELDRTSLSGEALVMAKEAHVRQSADSGLVALDKVLGHMEGMGKRGAARVVILDCCRNNPLGTKTLAAKSILPPKGGLGRVDAPKGMLIAFAARDGQVALQTEIGQPSLYTKALLSHILTPGLEVEQVFKRTRATVLDLSREEQEPAEYTNLTGNLVFNRSVPGSADGAAAVAAASELPKMKAELDDQRERTGIIGNGAVPPSGAPTLELPERGYFDLEALFSGSAYAHYNSYSKGQILRRAQNIMRQEGHYAGIADGLPGPGTQKALLDWQRRNLVTATGRLDSETLVPMKLIDLPMESQPQEVVRTIGKPSSPRQRSTEGASNPPTPRVAKPKMQLPPAAPSPVKSTELTPEEFLRRARALEN